MEDKKKSDLLENLVILYLRLNGYFTTSLIIHSNEKRIETQLYTRFRHPHSGVSK